MSIRGFLSHLELAVGDPSVSIEFYDKLLAGLWFKRTKLGLPGRASWRLDGAASEPHFEIEVRLARGTPRSTRHVRSHPGIDHLAFHADSEAHVDAVYDLLIANRYSVDEAPRTYDYSPGYYAVGFDDPDGIRLEVVFNPTTNP